ncbi:extensin-like domain-containing protein [Cobetia sp. L2A1]|uniref:extensin-like domain-containing protein n=1 Tax=Cobetia sp. L2A1 TaxID=2686360 RepID=UPI00131D377F|nr:extensin family protein [Cobetia sp. L2A1]
MTPTGHSRRRGGGKFTLVCMAAIILAVAIQRDVIVLKHWVPERYLPWAPLHLEDPPGLVTRWKLSRLDQNPEACRAFLENEVPRRVTSLPDSITDSGCDLINSVRVHDRSTDGVRFNKSFIASCPLAVSWLRFERHGLQAAAQEVLGSRVTGVTHLGSYACRNIYGRENARRSEHATADALDVAGFRLSDGREIRLPADWTAAGAQDSAGQFLRAVQQAACESFGTVLGPDYNAAHRDHFHLGTRGWSVCR